MRLSSGRFEMPTRRKWLQNDMRGVQHEAQSVECFCLCACVWGVALTVEFRAIFVAQPRNDWKHEKVIVLGTFWRTCVEREKRKEKREKRKGERRGGEDEGRFRLRTRGEEISYVGGLEDRKRRTGEWDEWREGMTGIGQPPSESLPSIWDAAPRNRLVRWWRNNSASSAAVLSLTCGIPQLSVNQDRRNLCLLESRKATTRRISTAPGAHSLA